MKLFGANLLTNKRIQLGEGYVDQYILFEHKRLFSLIFYKWFTVDQKRFHTHAFKAVAFLIKGWYWERVKFDKIEADNLVNQPFWPRFLPKNYCHAIKASYPGTLTFLITGPWDETWFEYFDDTETWVQYGHGRKVIGKFKELPK